MDRLTIFTSDLEIMYQTLAGMQFVFGMNSDFWGVLAACSMLGLFLAIVKKLSDPKEQPVFKWILSLTFVFMLSLAPVDVQVEQFDGSIEVRAIDDIPALVAMPAWLFSNIRHSIVFQFLRAFDTVDQTAINDPVAAFAALRHGNTAMLAAANVGAYKSLINYQVDCYSRQADSAADQNNNQIDMSKVPANEVWDKMFVGYTGWQTTVFNATGTAPTTVSCPRAHSLISTEFLAEGKFEYEDALLAAGVTINDMDAAFSMLNQAGLTTHQMLTSLFLKTIHTKVIAGMTPIQFQYELTEFQATRKQNSSDMFQYIFSARNTQMFIMFLEILTIVVTPILIIFTLLTNNLSILVFGGMYSLIPLVTTIMYIPIKLLMAHFFLANTGVGEPSSWIQIGSTINDAESAVASASALVLMVPALITMLVNKIFVGASSAASALSAANRNEANTDHVSPSINKAPNAGATSFGNVTNTADTSSSAAFHSGTQTSKVSSGDGVFDAAFSNARTAAQANSAQATETFQAQKTAALQVGSSHVLQDMNEFAKGDTSTRTFSADEKSVFAGLEELSQQYAKQNKVGIDEARQQVATDFTRSQLDGKLKFDSDDQVGGKLVSLGTGLSVSASQGVTNGEETKQQDSVTTKQSTDQTTQEASTTRYSDQMAATMTDLLQRTESAAETDKTSDTNSLSTVLSMSEQLSESESQQDLLSKTYQSTLGQKEDYKMDSEMIGRNFKSQEGGPLTTEGFFNEKLSDEQRQELTNQLRDAGVIDSNQTVDDYVAGRKQELMDEYRNNDSFQQAVKNGNAEGMLAARIVNDMTSDILNDKNPTLADATAETSILSDLNSAMGKVSGDTMFNEVGALFAEMAEMNKASSELAEQLGIDPTQMSDGTSMDDFKVKLDNKQTETKQDATSTQEEVEAREVTEADVKSQNTADKEDVKTHVEEAKVTQALNQDANELGVGTEQVFSTGLQKDVMAAAATTGDADQVNRLGDIRDGLRFMSENSSADVIGALSSGLSDNATAEQRELATDILAASGAEGQDLFANARGEGSEAYSNVATNMAAVADYINDNKADVIDKENGLSALLSNQGEDSINKYEERAIQKMADGDNVWTPQQIEDLKSAKNDATDLINKINSMEVTNSPLASAPDMNSSDNANLFTSQNTGDNVPAPLLASVDNKPDELGFMQYTDYSDDGRVDEGVLDFLQPDGSPEVSDNIMRMGANFSGVDNAAVHGTSEAVSQIITDMNDVSAGSAIPEHLTNVSNSVAICCKK